MSDTYHSASTMAWPGEEETDFNFRPPAWEILGKRKLKNLHVNLIFIHFFVCLFIHFSIYSFIYLFIFYILYSILIILIV